MQRHDLQQPPSWMFTERANDMTILVITGQLNMKL